MDLDIFVGYAADWTEYDHGYERYIQAAYGEAKGEALAEQMEHARWEFERDHVTDVLPEAEAWRAKLGISPESPAWYVGYIARSSSVYAFEHVDLDIEGEDGKGRRFPRLCSIISCGCNDYVENDWEITRSLAGRCLDATTAFLDGGGRDEGVRRAHNVLLHLVPLAGLILGTREPWNYRVLYSR